jgi:hypothetical protein
VASLHLGVCRFLRKNTKTKDSAFTSLQHQQDNSLPNGQVGRGSPSTPGAPTRNKEVIHTDSGQRTEAGTVNNSVRGDLSHSLVTQLEEVQKCIQLLKDMRDREWPPSLEDSWYKDIISRLYTIAENAEPAVAPVEGSARTGLVSSNLLCLTMQEAKDKLEEPIGAAKSILIKNDVNETTTTASSLKTIGAFLGQLQLYTTVGVQDLSRRRDEASGATWVIDKVKRRFDKSEPAAVQAPINLLDLNCTAPNVVPECICSQTMQFWTQLEAQADAGRPSNTVRPLLWHLLGEAKSGSNPHQDHCGFWTWVRVNVGKKLWFLCQLSDDDRKRFAADGPSFTGGKWFYVWLEPGDILIMPPGTVHAVFTPEDTLCTGGNSWSKKGMGDTMRSIAFETKYPNVTNDHPIPQIPGLLQKASQLMSSKVSATDFGSQYQIDEFSHYFQV